MPRAGDYKLKMDYKACNDSGNDDLESNWENLGGDDKALLFGGVR